MSEKCDRRKEWEEWNVSVCVGGVDSLKTPLNGLALGFRSIRARIQLPLELISTTSIILQNFISIFNTKYHHHF